jgi:hypothetical protein
MRAGGARVIWIVAVVLLSLPVLFLTGFFHLNAVVDLIDAGWRRLRPRPPRPSLPPVQKIAADLRRISLHIDALDASDMPAKAERLLAAALAYDGVLVSACRTFELPAPDGPPLHSIDRLQTEAALAQEGLVW